MLMVIGELMDEVSIDGLGKGGEGRGPFKSNQNSN